MSGRVRHLYVSVLKAATLSVPGPNGRADANTHLTEGKTQLRPLCALSKVLDRCLEQSRSLTHVHEWPT